MFFEKSCNPIDTVSKKMISYTIPQKLSGLFEEENASNLLFMRILERLNTSSPVYRSFKPQIFSGVFVVYASKKVVFFDYSIGIVRIFARLCTLSGIVQSIPLSYPSVHLTEQPLPNFPLNK